MSTACCSEKFSVRQARRIVADLFVHRPIVYWTDFLVSLAMGYTFAGLYFRSPLFSLRQLVCFLVAGFALFRVGSFIHEIVHLSGKTLRTFRITWNILAGIPMLMPSYFYENHIDHHSANHYGTGRDGEYLPLGHGTLHELLRFYLQAVLLPPAVFFRFLIMTPISFLHPSLRRWVLQHASSYVINLRYRRKIPADAPWAAIAALECCCCLRSWAVVGATYAGLVPWYQILLLYALGMMTLGLNYVRNLVAHHYQSEGKPISYIDQLDDSVNIEGVPVLTELFFPLNLRYHALHHLFPTLPYHNLPVAHRRLLAALPAGSLYHQTVYPGFLSVATQRFHDALVSSRRGSRALRTSKLWYARRRRELRRGMDGSSHDRRRSGQ